MEKLLLFCTTFALLLCGCAQKSRWKAPQAPDPSNETFDAGEFGLAALQAYSPSEVASSIPKGEDCLTFTEKVYYQWDQAGYLLKATGCKNMDELMALSEDELLKAMETNTGVPGISSRATAKMRSLI